MRRTGAFTLVEILIVVVILGILAAIVVPQFTNATNEASAMATKDQLVKVREALGVYYVRNNSRFPSQLQAGNGTWGELLTTGDYLREPPKNFWINPTTSGVIVFQHPAAPDPGYQTDHGWIFDPVTGDLFAGSFDANDNPYPKP